MRDWPKSPALHFLLIGGLLFAADSWRLSLSGAREGGVGSPRSVAIPAAGIERLRRDWLERTGRPPDDREERALLEHVVEEEILFREAFARGLDRRDDVVRRRLAELGRFLADDPDAAGEQTLVEEARRLGLDRSDLVVRRRLIELVRLEERRPEAPEPVTDAELREFFARESGSYRIPPRVTLTHVYLSRNRRGETVRSDARRLLAELRSAGTAPEDAPVRGDRFPRSFHLKHVSKRDLEQSFGAGFAAAAVAVEPGQWAGPIRSSTGEHLVWVHERTPARTPSFEAVRTRLLERLREERAEERLRRALRRLRDQYVIRIGETGDDPLLALATGESSGELRSPAENR